MGKNKYDNNESIIETLLFSNRKMKTLDGKFTFTLFSDTPIIYDINEPASGKRITIEEIKKNMNNYEFR
jgi:hypothetical protein